MFMKMMQQQQPLGLSLEHMGMEEDAVPFGSLEHEVADDLPVLLSEGEYVVPADVVRYWGLKHLEEMRTQAKCGLMYMEMDGRLQQVDNVDDDDDTDDAVDTDYEDVEVLEVSADDIDEEMSDLGIDQEEEVDFDGKEPIKMREGGTPGEQDRISDLDAAQKGFSRTTVDMTGIPAVTTLSAVSTQDEISQVAKDMVTEEFSAANERAKASSNIAVDAISTAMQVGMPMGNVVGGFVNTATVDMNAFGVTAVGWDGNVAIGGNAAMQAVSARAMREQVKTAINITLGLQSPQDLAVVDNEVVSVGKLGGLLGGVSLTGNVPQSMTVTDFDRISAINRGFNPSTVSRDPNTGLVDQSKAEPLTGTVTDVNPTTGQAGIVAGYSKDGNFNTASGVSAFGTAKAAVGLTEVELADLAAARGTPFDMEAVDKAATQASREESQASASRERAAAIANDFGASRDQISAHNEAVSRGNAPIGSSPNSLGGYSTTGSFAHSTNARGEVVSREEHDAEKAKGEVAQAQAPQTGLGTDTPEADQEAAEQSQANETAQNEMDAENAQNEGARRGGLMSAA